MCRPEVIFITSNYSLRDCYRENWTDVPALEARFHVFEFKYKHGTEESKIEQALAFSSILEIIENL